MEGVGSDTTVTTVTSPNSSSINSSPPQSQVVIISPCAACKILRRRCVEKCVLAPYFPPNDPLKFTTAHRVFGASNIIKFLQELPEPQRADAVSSMVYEANARLRDPVYGCAGAICQLQKQVNDLQEQLAKTKAELINMQCQNANLMALIYMEMSQSNSSSQITTSPNYNDQDSFDNFDNYSPRTNLSNAMFLDENNNLGLLYEQSLWA